MIPFSVTKESIIIGKMFFNFFLLRQKYIYIYVESRINIRRIEILWKEMIGGRVNKEGSRRRELLFAYRGNRFIIRSRSGNRVLCAKWHGEPPAERERERESIPFVSRLVDGMAPTGCLPGFLPSIREKLGRVNWIVFGRWVKNIDDVDR